MLASILVSIARRDRWCKKNVKLDVLEDKSVDGYIEKGRGCAVA